MDKKAWKKRYNDSADEFEKQRQQLIKTANRFVNRIDKSSLDTVFDILVEVSDFFNAHFKREEKMLKVIKPMKTRK